MTKAKSAYPTPLKSKRAANLRVSVGEAGQWLGISARRVRQLVEGGYIEKPVHNSVPLKGAIAGYVRFLAEAGHRRVKSAGDARLKEARAKNMEARTARELENLVPREEVAALLQAIGNLFAGSLRDLPAVLSCDRAASRRIDAAVDGIFQKMVDAIGGFGGGWSDLVEFHRSGTNRSRDVP